MVSIGACTWIFGDVPLDTTADMCVRSGLDGVELSGDWEAVSAAKARNILSDAGLDVFSITPVDADISHPDTPVRRSAVDAYRQMIDFAAEVGSPIIACHGQVGRISPIGAQSDEDAWLIESVSEICDLARASGLGVVWEVLNRYESHQIRTASEGLDLIAKVKAPNLKLLMDAYHMNIEEANPAAALAQAGADLGLYHAADSNREAVGRGHTDFASQFNTLKEIKYAGPVIVEICAPGPNPFTPDKGEGFQEIVVEHLCESVSAIRTAWSIPS